MRTRFCATPVSQISNGRHAGQSPTNCLAFLSGGCGWLERTSSLAGNTVVVTPPPPPKAIACRGGRRRRHVQDSCHIVSPPDASSRSVRAQEIWPQASGDATHLKETCGICTGAFFDGSCDLSPQPQEITQLHVPEKNSQGWAFHVAVDSRHTPRVRLAGREDSKSPWLTRGQGGVDLAPSHHRHSPARQRWAQHQGRMRFPTLGSVRRIKTKPPNA